MIGQHCFPFALLRSYTTKSFKALVFNNHKHVLGNQDLGTGDAKSKVVMQVMETTTTNNAE